MTRSAWMLGSFAVALFGAFLFAFGVWRARRASASDRANYPVTLLGAFLVTLGIVVGFIAFAGADF